MAAKKFKVGEAYDGPMAVFDGEEVGHVHGFYALTDDGKELRKPLVRLMHVDLAPGDDDDGNQEFRVAGKNDPPTIRSDKLVEFEAEEIQGAADVSI